MGSPPQIVTPPKSPLRQSHIPIQPHQHVFPDDYDHCDGNCKSRPQTNGSVAESDIYGSTPRPGFTTNGSSASFSSKKNSPPRTLLGAIDENNDRMAPDIPPRNNNRTNLRLPQRPLFTPTRNLISLIFPGLSRPDKLDEPDRDFDPITGPKGEKFDDLRANQGSPTPTIKQRMKRRWRCWAGLLLLGVIIIAVAAIAIIVVLTRRKAADRRANNDDNNNGNGGNNNSTLLTAFPIGTWTLSTYLLNATTSCTPNPATWRCYPYQTLEQSTTGSQTMLTWRITPSQNTTESQPSYNIMSDSNLFALPFNNTPLVLTSPDTPDEHWTFSLRHRKIVAPTAAITTDGSAAQCDYDDTVLSARLYTRRETNLGMVPVKSLGQWPGAVEVLQTSESGPRCAKIVDGVEGETVPLTGEAVGGECACEYANFE